MAEVSRGGPAEASEGSASHPKGAPDSPRTRRANRCERGLQAVHVARELVGSIGLGGEVLLEIPDVQKPLVRQALQYLDPPLERGNQLALCLQRGLEGSVPGPHRGNLFFERRESGVLGNRRVLQRGQFLVGIVHIVGHLTNLVRQPDDMRVLLGDRTPYSA